MIIIEEKKSNHLPCLTSLYFTLNIFNQYVFDMLKQDNEGYYDFKTNLFEFPITKLSFIINLLTKLDEVELKLFTENVLDKLNAAKYKFNVKPYEYQLEGINYGLNHNNWLLLDDQGLGKTLQIIYLAEVLKKRKEIEHCFIICGVNSLKYNWVNEIKKFTDLSYTLLGQYTTKKGKVKIGSVAKRLEHLKSNIKEFFVITNLETLQNKDFAATFNKSKTKFDMVVLDEAHHCKSPTSKSAKTLLKLKSERNIPLSGTIIMNEPEDSYVPLKWTKNIKCNFSEFKRLYTIYGGFGGVQPIGTKNLSLLHELIESCSLRRLKNEVLDLPDKTYVTEYVDLLPKQLKLYNEVSEGIAAELDLLPNRKMTIIQELTINMRLRQITAYPGILSSEITESAKLDRACELVEQIVAQGDKIVIFNTFKGAALELYNRLLKYNPVMCTGDLDDLEIDENKQIFNEDDSCKVMICTWQKMGTGHTLTAANYCIFIDTPWTDADFQQACDRIYRIGQNKKVTIITLIAKDTYDERVQEILDRKEVLTSYLIDGKNAEEF